MTDITASFKLLHSEVKPLTREFAEAFKNLEPSPTERELNPARVKHLSEKAQAGHLVNFNWASAKMGGKVLRMNGQHSSNMLCGLNGAFPAGLFVHLDEYEVNGPEGLALLFRQFDDRKSGRSSNDVSGAYQMLYAALHGVARPVGKLGIEGVSWWRRHVEGLPALSGDEQYTLFAEVGLHAYLLWLNEVFSIKTPELRRAQITAAMYATFNTDATAARKFWGDVARGGDEYDDSAPASRLDAWLKAAKEGKLEDEFKPAQFYQGSIYAWNAFREEKQLKEIKSDTRKGMHKVL